MIVVDKLSIKEASQALKLKYSTAKTIYKIYKNENRTVKFSSRSRNPGVGSSSAINKIQKAPIPKFILRSRIINSKNICGITKVKKMHRSKKTHLNMCAQ